MKFLANENFPHPSIAILRKGGYDVLSVQETRPSIADEEVVKWANGEGRIILTFDKDYGEIVFKYKIYCAVIFFRAKGQMPDDAGNKLLQILKEVKIEGYFTVIDKTGIRQREMKF